MTIPPSAHRFPRPADRRRPSVPRLGGELYNSTSLDPRYFGRVLAELAAAGVGTVIATVSWEQVDTTEGSFGFALLDESLAAARGTLSAWS